MSNLREQVKAMLLEHIKKDSDPFATDVLKVYEEVEHALLSDTINYGLEDRYTVKIIYRREDSTAKTYLYDGTFGELIREIVGYH